MSRLFFSPPGCLSHRDPPFFLRSCKRDPVRAVSFPSLLSPPSSLSTGPSPTKNVFPRLCALCSFLSPKIFQPIFSPPVVFIAAFRRTKQLCPGIVPTYNTLILSPFLSVSLLRFSPTAWVFHPPTLLQEHESAGHFYSAGHAPTPRFSPFFNILSVNLFFAGGV